MKATVSNTARARKVNPMKTDVWLVKTDAGVEGVYVGGRLAHTDLRVSVQDFILCLQEQGLAMEVDFRDGYLEQDDYDLPKDFKEIELKVG